MTGTGRRPLVNPAVAGVVAGLVIGAVVLLMGWINVNFAAPWARTHTVTAQVSDVDGIAVSSDVRIAGRLVGQVTEVRARGDHADVTVHIDDSEWPLPADTTAAIRLATLLGQKYLELAPGGDTAHHLAEDGVIRLTATRPVVDFDQVLDTFDQPTRDALTGLVRTLGAGVQGQEGNLQLLVPALRDLSVHGQAPTATLAQHDADLDRILTNLGTVADRLDRSRGDLAGVIDSMSSVTGALAANQEALRGFIGSTDALSQTAHRVLGSGGAPQLAAGLQQLDPVARRLDRLLTSLVPQTGAFQRSALDPAVKLVTEIGDATSQSDRDGYFLRQNVLGVDCSGILPTGRCTVPTAPPAALPSPPGTAPPGAALPSLPSPLLPLLPLLPGHGGSTPSQPLLPPLLGGLLGDWWPSAGDGGASLATLDLWGAS
jgi:phospholipid/cholesterol/gamma-HCH transport system substrate-binding protein